jgi:hypothetical protein
MSNWIIQDCDFQLNIDVDVDAWQCTRRWSMVLKPKFVPWRPALTLTGTSDYAVNTATGQITSHLDTWDALSDNSYLSVSR